MNLSIGALSSRLHDIYQKEAHRRGDVRHHDNYNDLSEDTKEWDRVLARWTIKNFTPKVVNSLNLPIFTEIPDA